jgi:hypothetical protein
VATPGVVQWAFRGRFSREPLMINRGRSDIRRLAAASAIFGFAGFLVDAVGWRPVYLGGGLVDVACAVAVALSLRWATQRPAESGAAAVPHAAEP